MIVKEITGNEETIDLEESDDVQVDGVFSFQNISSYSIRWSTEEFSATNQGSLLNPTNERVFSAATTIYFKQITMDASVQCRAIEL